MNEGETHVVPAGDVVRSDDHYGSGGSALATGPIDLRVLLETPPYAGGRTGMDYIAERLKSEAPATYDLLMQRLADPTITSTWLVKVLRQAGYQVGETTVQRYRRTMRRP